MGFFPCRWFGEREPEHARICWQKEEEYPQQTTVHPHVAPQEGQKELKTLVEIGSGVYCQARVPDTSRIFMSVGLGFQVECTLEEAVEVAERRRAALLVRGPRRRARWRAGGLGGMRNRSLRSEQRRRLFSSCLQPDAQTQPPRRRRSTSAQTRRPRSRRTSASWWRRSGSCSSWAGTGDGALAGTVCSDALRFDRLYFVPTRTAAIPLSL